MDETIGFFDIFWSILWIFLMVAWIWVVISVLTDVFRSRDLGGVAKALWVLFIIVIPWLGVLAYIIARADEMDQHRQESAKQLEEAQIDYIRGIVGSSPAAELEKLAALKEKGLLTDDEFAAQKARLLGA
jgi:hypothetical protein